MKIFDLSHTIDNNTLVYPGDPNPEINKIADLNSDGYIEHKIILTTHLATHIDSPGHIIKNGKNLDEFTLAHFTGKAFIAKAEYDKTGEINFNFPTEQNFEHLIINTNWHKKWGTPDYFVNYPVLPVHLTKLIVRHELKSVGFDTCSVDKIENFNFPIHHIFLEKNILIIENLTGLEPLNNEIIDLFVFPLKIKSIEGSPVRAVAIRK